MAYFGYFPLIAIIVLFYNFMAFGGQVLGGAGGMDAELAKTLFSITMVSGDIWKVTIGDLFILLGLGMLFQEILRSANPDKSAIINHGLSMALFVIALVEFLIFKGFATSTFFLIMCMTLFDVVAGFTISILAARRDIDVGSGSGLKL